jgi:L-methionine (R)-S-oxide reductase
VVSEQETREVLARLEAALGGVSRRKQGAQIAVELLGRLPHFHWTGVYWLEGRELVLGPYVGAPTEHTRIPVGRGVCGAAVAQDANQIVRDVGDLDNYLACSLETKSEIVVLIRDDAGAILGQIDVDAREVGAFDESDEALLEQVARRIAGLPEQS